MRILHRAESTATCGQADVSSDSGDAFSVALMRPSDSAGEGASPEQLFAAGYSACFLSTLQFVAEQGDVALGDQSSVTAAIGIGSRADGEGFGLDVALTVNLPGLAPDVAHGLIEQALIVCPYSHLARNGLDVRVALAG